MQCGQARGFTNRREISATVVQPPNQAPQPRGPGHKEEPPVAFKTIRDYVQERGRAMRDQDAALKGLKHKLTCSQVPVRMQQCEKCLGHTKRNEID